MNILKILFLLPLSIMCLKMTAQVDDLLKNKDITWIAETYNDFLTNESIDGKNVGNTSHSRPLKLVNKTEETLDDNTAIMQWLVTAIESGKMLIYRDSNCTERLNAKHFWRAGTICQINPYTYEMELKVIPNCINFALISTLRARQIIYYNARKAQFGMQTLAIAPLYNLGEYDSESGQFKTIYKPIFWFKPKNLNKTQRLSKNTITWARRMSFINGISIDKDSVKILKNTQGITPMNHLLASFETNPKIPFYQRENSNPTRKMDFQERKMMFTSRDTIVHWLENQEKPEFQIINNDLTASELGRLQLLQNWYWNNRKKRLEIRLVATAPMKEVFLNSYFNCYVPIFYRRTDN